MSDQSFGLATGRQYHARTDRLTGALLAASARLMGEDPQGPSLGTAFVLALRTLISWGHLPDGAVMLGHRATWFTPFPVEADVETTLSIAAIGEPGRRYRAVTLEYRTVADAGSVVTQQQEVLWPNTF